MEFYGETESEYVNALFTEAIPPERASIHSAIREKLLFYFGYVNLPSDTFLKNEMKTNNGWVKINALLLTYKELASITRDPAVIAAAIKNGLQTILEVDETNEKVRLIEKISNTHVLTNLVERSVFCKGFPRNATFRELSEFAATFGDKVIAQVSPIGMHEDNTFTGTLFLTFNFKEQAECFLKQKSIKYKDVEIECKSEKDYREEIMKHALEFQKKELQKMENGTEINLKKQYLIKAEFPYRSSSADEIKTICSKLKWQIEYVKIGEDQKTAWIRLKPVKAAKDLLQEISDKMNDLLYMGIVFSIPEEEIEQMVLHDMLIERDNSVARKVKRKRKKKKKKKKKKNNNYKGKRGNKKKGKKRQYEHNNEKSESKKLKT